MTSRRSSGVAAAARHLLPSAGRRLVSRVDPAGYGANFDAIGSAARARGIPVVFLKVCCCKEGYNEKLDEAARRHGIRVVTVEEVMSTAIAKPEERQKHSRLNPLGAELVVVAALADSPAAELGRGSAP